METGKPLEESVLRLRRMLRTKPGKVEAFPRSAAIVEGATRALRVWAAGVPVIGGKPTDREAFEWLEGFTAAAWIDRVEYILQPILDANGGGVVWAPDPWPDNDLAVLFVAVVQALTHGTTAATCKHARSHPSAWACPTCGHERWQPKSCRCFNCEVSRFATTQRKGEK